MDAIIPYVHSCKGAQGCWQSQDGLDGASSVYLRSLSSACGPEMDVAFSLWWWWRPAGLCEPGPCGRCHLPSLHVLSHYCFISHPFVCRASDLAENWTSYLPPILPPLPSLNLCFISIPLSLPLPTHRPSQSARFKGQAPALLAPRFPFDWPNSLFTSPRHKRHQTDWSAGRSQGTADQWGLGQRGGGDGGG